VGISPFAGSVSSHSGHGTRRNDPYQFVFAYQVNDIQDIKTVLCNPDGGKSRFVAAPRIFEPNNRVEKHCSRLLKRDSIAFEITGRLESVPDKLLLTMEEDDVDPGNCMDNVYTFVNNYLHCSRTTKIAKWLRVPES
jgi:hypothetical protein